MTDILSAPKNGAAQPLVNSPRRAQHAGAEPVAEGCMTIQDWCRLLQIGRRTAERFIAAGRIPAADFHLNRRPRWRVTTYQAWLAKQG
jgi:hypothetical protein